MRPSSRICRRMTGLQFAQAQPEAAEDVQRFCHAKETMRRRANIGLMRTRSPMRTPEHRGYRRRIPSRSSSRHNDSKWCRMASTRCSKACNRRCDVGVSDRAMAGNSTLNVDLVLELARDPQTEEPMLWLLPLWRRSDHRQCLRQRLHQQAAGPEGQRPVCSPTSSDGR